MECAGRNFHLLLVVRWENRGSKPTIERLLVQL
jgi:hypothetical protein